MRFNEKKMRIARKLYRKYKKEFFRDVFVYNTYPEKDLRRKIGDAYEMVTKIFPGQVQKFLNKERDFGEILINGTKVVQGIIIDPARDEIMTQRDAWRFCMQLAEREMEKSFTRRLFGV